MDERIDLITVQVDTVNQQIQRLSTEQHHLMNDDDNDDNWMDVVDKELQIGILDNTDAQVAYEIALSLIRSLEPEEARLVSEALMEDIIQLKADQQHNTTSIRHLTAMLNSLQLGLVQMRRVGNNDRANDSIYEEEEDEDFEEIFTPSTSSTENTFSTPTNQMTTTTMAKKASLLDSLFIKMLSSPVDIRCGLVLPK